MFQAPAGELNLLDSALCAENTSHHVTDLRLRFSQRGKHSVWHKHFRLCLPWLQIEHRLQTKEPQVPVEANQINTLKMLEVPIEISTTVMSQAHQWHPDSCLRRLGSWKMLEEVDTSLEHSTSQHPLLYHSHCLWPTRLRTMGDHTAPQMAQLFSPLQPAGTRHTRSRSEKGTQPGEASLGIQEP